MRLVVTGGRHYSDNDELFRALDALRPAALAHGACPTGSPDNPRGADWLADIWARENGLVLDETLFRYPADWNRHQGCQCRRERQICGYAGPRRNGFMLADFRPTDVAAVRGGNGTQDCVRQALAKRIRVRMVQPGRLVVVRRLSELRWT